MPARTPSSSLWRPAITLALALTAAGLAQAGTGKLPLTGGVTSVDGAAGGGISPWALIGTQAADDEVGLAAHLGLLQTGDYQLRTRALSLGWHGRLELSLGEQDLAAGPARALNGLGFQVEASPHVQLLSAGLKLRLSGDGILDTDEWLPQVSVGLLARQVDAGTVNPVLDFLGARRQGLDVYLSATKLLMAQRLLLNLTLRSTEANQGGLLGFGAAGPGGHRRRWMPEASAALLLDHDLAVGLEYRRMPDKLDAPGMAAGLGHGLREDAWRDLFLVWAPHPQLSLTGAVVDLGRVLPGLTEGRRQRGGYLGLQAGF